MNPTLLTDLLIRIDWDAILEQDIDKATTDFTRAVLDAAAKAIPQRQIIVRDADKGWVTCELKRFIRKRERLYRIS